MSRVIAFYVSTHGFGHATRSSAIMAELQRLQPDWRICVRSVAPQELFPASVLYEKVAFDPGAVESGDTLRIDTQKTALRVEEFFSRADALLAAEREFLRSYSVSAAVADMPFLAGELPVPTLGVGNFTWDWIYEPFVSGALLERIRSSYRKFQGVLRLPFSHNDGWQIFPWVRDVPLVARQCQGDRAALRRRLPADDKRGIVLLGGRGSLSESALDRANKSRRYRFVFAKEMQGFSFSEVLLAADAVLAKLGYSTVAECIAAGTPLLYPPRFDMREEAVMEASVGDYVRARALPLAEFESGQWEEHVDALLAGPAPPLTMRSDGAAVCAQFIATSLVS